MGGGSMLRPAARPMIPAGLRPGRSQPFSNSNPPSRSPVSASFPCAARSRTRFGEAEPEQLDRFIFGPAPSEEEAESALSAIKQVFTQISTGGTSTERAPSPIAKGTTINGVQISNKIFQTEQDSIGAEPDNVNDAKELGQSKLSHSRSKGLDRIRSSFDLLQGNSSVRRLVVSLSTDKAVWDAIMRNEAVQELHQCFLQAGKNEPLAFVGQDEFLPRILQWILENAKIKIIELIDNISDLIGALFHSRDTEATLYILGDVIRSSFMLAVMVIIVVMVARLHIE